MLRKRTRARNVRLYKTRKWYYTNPAVTSYVSLVDREHTVDEEHAWHALRRLMKDARFYGYVSGVEMGGEFTSVKSKVELKNLTPVALRAWPHEGLHLYNYEGPLIPPWLPTGALQRDVVVNEPLEIGADISSCDIKANGDKWPSVEETDEELAVLGASLVGKLAPTAPHNNVYTSLGELRNDGLPSIPFLSFLKKGGEGVPQKVGGEYLNYQFGIAPTVSDVKNILKTIKEADKLWRQYLRDSGRLVRRRFDMDPEVTTEKSTIVQQPWYIPHGTSSYHWSSIGDVDVTTTTTRKRWFSAAYTYYVDKSSLTGMEGGLAKAQHLYGWKPSPSGVYNLTAWSWLLDWFTNTGDVIDNISLYLEDPFLTRRAYIMEHSSVEKSFSQTVITNDGTVVRLEATLTVDIKKRRKVNPFHMGFKGETLNGHQLAILAALGMTKGRNPGSM